MPKEPAKTFDGLQHYNLIYGKWRIKSSRSNPNAVHRQTTKGKDIWELCYEALSGELQKLEITDGPFGKELTVFMKDPEDGAIMALHMDVYSFIGKSFLRRVENIDITRMLRLALYNINDKDTGKPKDILSVYQYNEEATDPKNQWMPVENKYPAWQGLPPVSEYIRHSKVEKDATARIETLLSNIEERFIPICQETPFRKDKRVQIPKTDPGPVQQNQSQNTSSYEQAPPPTEPPPYLPEDED